MDSGYLSLLEGARGVRRERLPGGPDQTQLTAAGRDEHCVVRSVCENCGGGMNFSGGACRKKSHFYVTELLRNLPPRRSDLPPRSARGLPCCLRPEREGSASGFYFFSRPPVGSLALRPG